MKGLTFLACLLAVLVYESLLHPLVAVAGIKPDVALIFTAYFALTYGSLEGLFFGFVSGFFIDLLAPSLLGWGMLLRLGLGLWMGGFKDNLFLESFYSKGVISGLAVIGYEIFYELVKCGFSPSATLYTLTHFSLPSALYSALVSFVWFYFVQRRKRKEISLQP